MAGIGHGNGRAGAICMGRVEAGERRGREGLNRPLKPLLAWLVVLPVMSAAVRGWPESAIETLIQGATTTPPPLAAVRGWPESAIETRRWPCYPTPSTVRRGEGMAGI